MHAPTHGASAGASPLLESVGLVCAMPFRHAPERLAQRLLAFNQRHEIQWFGLSATLESPGDAVVRFARLDAGVLGGGGIAAINGGVIAAGFDAACVLAALTQTDSEVAVTLTLQVSYLRLARVSDGLEFRAQVTRATRRVCFVQGVLIDAGGSVRRPLATATATLAPV